MLIRVYIGVSLDGFVATPDGNTSRTVYRTTSFSPFS